MLLIDGATGTELERAGVDVSLPLWSARALIEAPRVVQAIHEAYLEAGAGAITTNTFRTHERSLARGGRAGAARALTRRAVELARAARDAVAPRALVLGSVAPLEDCYTPALAPAADVCAAEHERMMRDLLDGGVDFLLIETMGTVREAVAAARVARRLAAGRWIISFCLKSTGPPGVLLSGERVEDVLRDLDGPYAVGANCVAATVMRSQVESLRAATGGHVPIAAYANIGYADEAGNWVCTDAIEPQRYAELASGWVEAGATIVGGCCGTSPATIRALAERLARGGDEEEV